MTNPSRNRCYATPLMLCELDCDLNRDDNIKHSVCFQCAPKLFESNGLYPESTCPFCRHRITKSVLSQHLSYRLFNETTTIFLDHYHSDHFCRAIVVFCGMAIIIWICRLFRYFVSIAVVITFGFVICRYCGYQSVKQLVHGLDEWMERQRQIQRERAYSDRLREM